MTQKEFTSFYSHIEVCEFGDKGYIYYYGTNISLCRSRLFELSSGNLSDIKSYLSMHKLTATIVLTKVRFWKTKQLDLNRELSAAGAHMDRATILKLYECNDFLLRNSAEWIKKWQDQPVFKAAVEAKKRKKWFS